MTTLAAADMPLGAGADPEHAAARREIRRAIEEAIDALPVEFRIVFMLRAVEPLSVKETAEFLGIPEDTVKARFHRANDRLRRSLSKQFASIWDDAFPFAGKRCDQMVATVLARIAGARAVGGPMLQPRNDASESAPEFPLPCSASIALPEELSCSTAPLTAIRQAAALRLAAQATLAGRGDVGATLGPAEELQNADRQARPGKSCAPRSRHQRGLLGKYRAPEYVIEAPWPRAGEEDIEEDEAIEDRRITAVQLGKEVLRKMRHEIGDGHVPGQDKSGGPCEQSDAYQSAADQLDHSLQADQREQVQMVEHRNVRKSEELR
jgi:hypothetical protein